MKKFSIMMVSLVAMASIAFAQQKAPGAGSGAAPATKAPAAGAGSAKAPAAGAAAGSAAPAVAMEKPKPPTEIKDALKMMGTRQTCTGTTWGGPEGKTEMKMKATGTNALALDGFWIKGSTTITMGEGKAKHTLKIDSYMTWDAKAAKWRNVGMANDGSVMVGTADMKDGKLSSQSDMYGGMMGTGKFRETGDMTDPKAGFKMMGEMSMDGKTWTKVYDMVCKK
ncbi:MAG TPA: hypothetical protein VIV11_12880 [Kofleriaceae bacterium]